VNSAVYEGTLLHSRRSPRHAFAFPIAMPLLQLDELDKALARHPLWSIDRTNAVTFRRADFLGDRAVPLDTAVRDLVESRLRRRPEGPIRMLAHLRTWGWLFNPITIYFCMDDTGRHIQTLVLDVANTPWHEHHVYVIDGGEGEHRFPKELHVSPFFGSDHVYQLRLSEPGKDLHLHLASLKDETVVFEATLELRRREMSRAALGRVIWRYPLLTLRVSAGIYWQALRLRIKGAPVFRHPADNRRNIAARMVER